MPKPKIRRAKPEDAGVICEMITELAQIKRVESQVRPKLSNLRYELETGLHTRLYTYVAFVHGAPVGYAICYPVFSTLRTEWMLFLEDLYVRDPYRSQGIGTAIMKAIAGDIVVSLSKPSGKLHGLFFNVMRDSECAKKFYRRHGAREMKGWEVQYIGLPDLQKLIRED